MPDSNQPPSLVLENYVPGLLSWLQNKYASDGSEVYRRLFDIGIAEWNVLAYLGVFGTGSGSEMGRFLGMDKAAVSRAIGKLKTKGLATSTNIDKRSIEVKLTKLGSQRYAQITQVALEREQILLNGLTASERKAVVRLMHKMLGNLQQVYEFGESLKDRPD